MNPMPTTKLTRTTRTLGVLAAVAGFLLANSMPYAHAQNAAQRAALAHLGRANSSSNSAPVNGVEASSIALDQPSGLSFDLAGNLYIADTADNIVREVNLGGIITTVAGDGEQGFGGDNGPATSALLDSPVGVAVDAAGNIYIGDTHNNRVREVVASSGNIVTIAGTGAAGFSGDGSSATAALLNLPTAVAVDSNGNVYFADTNNHRIREVSGGNITTVAGDGEQMFSGDGGLATAAGLDSPGGVAVDAAFNLYIGDTHNQRVRMVTFSTGIISTLAGTGVKTFNSDGAAATAALARPQGVGVDSQGIVYVADSDNNRIRTIAGGTVTTIAGNGDQGLNGDTDTSTTASLDTPRSVAVAGTSIVFADTQNDRVRAVTSGTVNTIAGLSPVQNETLVLSGPLSMIYGSGTLTATFANGSATGTGSIAFYDGQGPSPALIGSASLAANTASISAGLLSVGTHRIVASYPGDATNSAVTSGVYVLQVTPYPLTASATSVNQLYGQVIPTLTGALNTVLAQDAGNVIANFATTATIASDPGIYPITATLTGSAAGNYTLTLAPGSGSLTIAQAPTTTTLTLSSQPSILGTALTLKAAVASTTSGAPGGSVSFYNGVTLLNPTPALWSGGVATFVINTLPVGVQSLTAVYSGNVDFLGSTSPVLSEPVLSPDFGITASPANQTVLPTSTANYSIVLTPVNPTFVYPVSFSATGLPAGVTATFAPTSLPVGAGVSTVVMTLNTTNQVELRQRNRPFAGMTSYPALALLMLPLVFSRRVRNTARRLSKASRMPMALIALAVLSTLAGCGGGGFFSHSTQTITVTVNAVSGPETHSTNVTLIVQ